MSGAPPDDFGEAGAAAYLDPHDPPCWDAVRVVGGVTMVPLTDTEKHLLDHAVAMGGCLTAGYLSGVPGFMKPVYRLLREGFLCIGPDLPGFRSSRRYQITDAGRAALTNAEGKG